MTPGTVRLLQAYPSLSSQASVNGVRRPSTPVGPRTTPFSPLRLMSSNEVLGRRCRIMLFAHLWTKLGPAHTRGRSAKRFLATGRRTIDGHPGRRRFAAVLPGMRTADRRQILHSAGSGGRNVCPLPRSSAGSHPRLGTDGNPRDEPIRAHRLRAMAARGVESGTRTSNLIHRP